MVDKLPDHDITKFIMEDMSEEKEELLLQIWEHFQASDDHKDAIGMYTKWEKNYNYWAGDVNIPESDEDPGSETNIIKPVIESQIADLVEADYDIQCWGEDPSDDAFADDIQHIMRHVLDKNQLQTILDAAERSRLNMGTSVLKVYYDDEALRGKGLPIIENKDINLIFPDPRVSDPFKIQKGEYFIEAMPMSLYSIQKMWPDTGKYVRAEGNWESSKLTQIHEDKGAGINETVNDIALVLEYWWRDEENTLRRIYATREIILEDSDTDDPHEGAGEISEDFYKHGNFPFVIIPCYKDINCLWGRSDTEDLIPIQDLINDLDDQIRMNARLMGNVQIVVGLGAGINLKKWTNKAGLRIPSKDPKAFQVVQPGNLPYYIVDRRNQGFQESEIISGRTDITEGRKSGSIRAAAAIAALQEAGSRRANHKRLMLLKGFTSVLHLVLEYVKEFMDETRCFKIMNKEQAEYKWFRGTDLNSIPQLGPNENFNPLVEEPGTEEFVPQTEEVLEDGQSRQEPITKEIDIDLKIAFGSGLPNNSSFLYQSSIELMSNNIITQEEARMVIKDSLNYPIIKPSEPMGQYAGRQMSGDQLAIANGEVPPGAEQPMQEVPPQGGQGAPDERAQLLEILKKLPPEVLAAITNGMGTLSPPGQAGGGMGGGMM